MGPRDQSETDLPFKLFEWKVAAAYMSRESALNVCHVVLFLCHIVGVGKRPRTYGARETIARSRVVPIKA